MVKKKVSVIVITYNSENYIEELLESIKKQTYDNIELIISDDSSTDDTIQISEKWCEKNKERFSTLKILTKEKNEGITYNYNSGYRAATGEYIKFIEGDDLLLPRCIEDNMKFILSNNIRINFSRAILFGDNIKQVSIPNISKKMMNKYTDNPKKTYDILLKNDIFVNPTIFIKKELLDEYSGFNNCYKMMVDYPFLIKITSKEEKIGFLDKETVKYRQHDKNLSLSDKNDTLRYISPIFYDNMKRFYINELKQRILENNNIFTRLEVANFFWVQDLILKKGNTVQIASKYNKLRLLCFWMYIRKLKERI